MRLNQYDKVGRFWLFNTTVEKLILRIVVAIVSTIVLLKYLGYID